MRHHGASSRRAEGRGQRAEERGPEDAHIRVASLRRWPRRGVGEGGTSRHVEARLVLGWC